ncbi:hypothetical protein GOODEAATRI_030010 [Goodea atripinnis]|uniref:Uncharacterized protein n=1 Tax=Goodea atripinnis TaxID=208336 RepID=A0ABV0MM03_9TELE
MLVSAAGSGQWTVFMIHFLVLEHNSSSFEADSYNQDKGLTDLLLLQTTEYQLSYQLWHIKYALNLQHVLCLLQQRQSFERHRVNMLAAHIPSSSHMYVFQKLPKLQLTIKLFQLSLIGFY